MNPSACSCTESELLLAFHRELPPPALLRVQLHRLLCPECRVRYRKLSGISRQLTSAMNPHSAVMARPSMPLWGAVLLCGVALSTAAWTARACFYSPDYSVSCPSSESYSASIQPCETSK